MPPATAPYRRCSGLIAPIALALIALYFLIYKKFKINPKVTPMQREIYDRPATPSGQCFSSLKVMVITDKKRKVMNQVNAIHIPKKSTTGSDNSIAIALTDEL